MSERFLHRITCWKRNSNKLNSFIGCKVAKWNVSIALKLVFLLLFLFVSFHIDKSDSTQCDSKSITFTSMCSCYGKGHFPLTNMVFVSPQMSVFAEYDSVTNHTSKKLHLCCFQSERLQLTVAILKEPKHFLYLCQ